MANNNNLPAIRTLIQGDSIQNSIKARIGEKAGTFTTSLLDLIGEDKNLALCDPMLVVKQALKAAAMDLPINKNLGLVYVIPYKKQNVYTPEFQMGWKGWVQLLIRTGQLKILNPGLIYEGEEIIEDRIRGTIEITGEKTSETAIGYFAYLELLNGFNKTVAWTKEKVEAHAKRFSKSYGGQYSSPWKTDFDKMALKTMVLQLKAFFPVTIEMSTALASDRGDFSGFEGNVQQVGEEDANSEFIDIPSDVDEVLENAGKADKTEETRKTEETDTVMSEAEKADIMNEEATTAEKGPGF